MVQDRTFLTTALPRELFELPLDACTPWLREDEPLSDRELEALDYVVRNQVARALGQRSSADALEELSDSIAALVPVEREEAMRPWVTRWRGMAAVLDARAASLDAQDVDEAMRMAHAPEIVKMVREEPGITQGVLRERLALKPANLSRILGILEASELVERRKVGRQNQLFPGPQTPEPPSPRDEPAMKSPRLFLVSGKVPFGKAS